MRLQRIRDWDDDGMARTDLGYEGEADLFRIPIKKGKGTDLTDDQQAYDAVRRTR